MNPFVYRQDRLCAEGLDLAKLAGEVGTPCFVYSRAALEERYSAFARAFNGRDHLICYAVKANSNLAVLNLLARLGGGFDVVSGGELARVLAAGGDAAKVVFSGVGKTEAEMRAALIADILCFNVESEPELEALDRVAGSLGRRARVSLRVNPDVDPATHPYIATGLSESKFGIPIESAFAVYRRAAGMANVEVVGVDCHIGSQITELRPFVDALERVLSLVGELADAGIALHHLDLGGGLGIAYGPEEAPEPDDYVLALLDALQSRGSRYQNLRILIEPGRAIAGNSGVLLTRVLYLKNSPARNFAVVDAAMSDLVRPALYEAWHDIAPVVRRGGQAPRLYDVVGPVCESGDFLGLGRELAIEPGDLLAVASAGAYGFVMSSNYNTRPRAAEVMVDGDRYHVVRRRETVAELFALESVLPSNE
jgi:diaminopimelate decarboxylase